MAVLEDTAAILGQRLHPSGKTWDDLLDAAVMQGLGDEEAALVDSGEAAEDVDSRLVDLHATLTQEVERRLQSAAARTVLLLRRGPSTDELKQELESWMLEGGRMQARLEDALAAGLVVVRESQARLPSVEAELGACRRALEVQMAQAAAAAREAAQRELAAAREREAEAARAAAELAAARAEAEEQAVLHKRRLRQVCGEEGAAHRPLAPACAYASRP